MRKTIFLNILITLLLITIFDVTAFSFLPSYYVSNMPEYRRSPPPDVAGHGRLPYGYFVAHDARGFDIGRNKSGRHWVDGVTYAIWSNSFRCFDNEHAEQERYVYFAGDSFAWGFTPFEQKFGTVIERITNTQIFKCGVTHTGQRHQFEKLVQVAEEKGKAPRAIFVFFSLNDVANDYAHPHTTVIHGWLVDNVSLDENSELIRHPHQELEHRVEDRLARIQQREDESRPWAKSKRILKYYSISVNILGYVKDYVGKLMVGVSAPPSGNVSIKSIYTLPYEKNGRFWYFDNPKAQENKSALLDFSTFSTRNNAEFVVVLIPPREKANDPKWYEELRNFLAANEISHIDLAMEFEERKLTQRDLYWVRDRHLSPSGNKIVSDILLEEFPHIFERKHATN